MRLPDKHIRKFFSNSLTNLIVDGKVVKTYDTNTPNNDDQLVVMSTQSNLILNDTKCGYDWQSTILIDIVTRQKGHSGSRVFAENITDEVLKRCEDIVIDGYLLQDYTISFPSDLTLSNESETINRKFIQYQLKLTENG